MSEREGCLLSLAVLLDKTVKHYGLTLNRRFIDLNDVIVWDDVLGCDCRRLMY